MSKSPKLWSGKVTRESRSLTLEDGVFRKGNPIEIAKSLALSAKKSHRRKGSPFQSSMSMLNFYINRAGTNLSSSRRALLNRVKTELRRIFGREIAR
jgi:hypothetical protein